METMQVMRSQTHKFHKLIQLSRQIWTNPRKEFQKSHKLLSVIVTMRDSKS